MLTRRATLGVFAASPALLLLRPTPAMAMEPQVFQRNGYAIGGTDTVAYQAELGPVQGNPEISLEWNGATWLFETEANRDLFASNPDQFAPGFGGYCAFAASRGYLAPTIPEAWHIHDGKLYLNATLRARQLWLAELPDVIAAGEANWPAILG